MGALGGLAGLSGLSAVAGSVPMVPWLPTMEPSLRLFLDYRDASRLITSGGNVTQWRDRSINGYAYNSTGTVPLGADGVNFSGSGSSMSATTRLGLGAASQFTVVSLLKNMGTPPTSGNNFFHLGASAEGAHVFRNVGNSGGVGAFRFGGSKTFQASPSGDLITSWYQPDNATYADVFLRQNGVDQSQVGLSNGTLVSTNITESSIFGATPWNFTLPVFLVFASDNATIRERAEGWIAHEFGSTALLDPSHPFKFSPPMVPAPA